MMSLSEVVSTLRALCALLDEHGLVHVHQSSSAAAAVTRAIELLSEHGVLVNATERQAQLLSTAVARMRSWSEGLEATANVLPPELGDQLREAASRLEARRIQP